MPRLFCLFVLDMCVVEAAAGAVGPTQLPQKLVSKPCVLAAVLHLSLSFLSNMPQCGVSLTDRT